MPRHGAGLGRKARLNLAPPFHSLITRLIHAVTYVTILPYDLLSSGADGEIGPEKEGGEGDCLNAANQHACAQLGRVSTAGPVHVRVYKVNRESKTKIY